MTKTKGHSSDIVKEFYGNTQKYVEIMKKWADHISKAYPNKNLSTIFSGLKQHIATIMPMAFCDSLASDLGKKADDQILAIIGLSCLSISTHDDVVDEKPSDRRTIARLIYGGNIAGLYGMKLLFDNGNKLLAEALIDTISQNHWLQQEVVEKLWQGKKVTTQSYLDGIKHICIFTTIGPLCALALTKKMKFKEQILEFSEGYGVALQLIDDLREMGEDKKTGYSSLPLSERSPFRKSFEQLYFHIIKARRPLKPDWKRMHKFLDNIEDFAKGLEKEINKDNNKIVFVVSGVLRNNKNQLLLLKRSKNNSSNKGIWQLPEGKMEAGETPEGAVIREIKEETNLNAQNPKLLIQFTHPMRVRKVQYNILRMVFGLEWSGKVALSQDHNEYRWVKVKEANSLNTIVGTKKILGSLA